MFEGQDGKDAMIRQGYVPPTCTLNPIMAGDLIHREVSAGMFPCWGCHEDRKVCKGQPLNLQARQRICF